MQRRIIGIVAIILLAVAVLFYYWEPPMWDLQVKSFCWRVGALLAVWWLAFPDLERMSLWILLGIPVLIVVAIKAPVHFLLFLIPLVIVLAILKPRFGAKR